MTGGFETVAIGLSVLMHVTWNLIARHQPRDSEPLWWVLLGHLILVAPWGLYRLAIEAQWSLGLLGLLLLSAAANVLYFHGLQRAYQHAPVAFVYPLVRSSPLLIAAWSLLFFGESLGVLAWTGIAISVLGLGAMARTARGQGEAKALPWTLLAMLATSVYSLSDKAATSKIAGFGGIVGYLSIGYLAAWSSMTWRRRRRTGRWVPSARPRFDALLLGSLCVGLAYALVIHAMRTLPAAEVVAYTNTGIVLATVLSIAVFGERTRWRQRVAAASVVCVGLVCIGVGRVERRATPLTVELELYFSCLVKEVRALPRIGAGTRDRRGDRTASAAVPPRHVHGLLDGPGRAPGPPARSGPGGADRAQADTQARVDRPPPRRLAGRVPDVRRQHASGTRGRRLPGVPINLAPQPPAQPLPCPARSAG